MLLFFQFILFFLVIIVWICGTINLFAFIGKKIQNVFVESFVFSFGIVFCYSLPIFVYDILIRNSINYLIYVFSFGLAVLYFIAQIIANIICQYPQIRYSDFLRHMVKIVFYNKWGRDDYWFTKALALIIFSLEILMVLFCGYIYFNI